MSLPPLLPRSEPVAAATPPPVTTTTHTTPPTADGHRLHLTAWTRPSVGGGVPPPGVPPVVVLIHHGLGEHGGRYERIAAALLGRVPALLAVYAHDAVGHGRSPGRRGIVPGGSAALAADWLSTVLPTVGGLLPRTGGVRVVLLGHSLGGLTLAAVAAGPPAAAAAALTAGRVSAVAGAAAAAGGDGAAVAPDGDSGDIEVVGLILSSAALRIRAPGLLKLVLPLARPAAAAGLASVPVPSGIDPAALTHAADEVDRIRADGLAHTRTCVGLAADMASAGGGYTAAIAAAAAAGGGGCLASAPGVGVLVLASPADPLCDVGGSRALVAALGGGAAGGGERVVAVEATAGALHEWMWEDEAHGRGAWHDAVAAFVAGGGRSTGEVTPAVASTVGAG